MNIDVANILKNSQLKHVEEFRVAISNGWRVDILSSPVKCRELYQIYKIRHQNLLSLSGEHAKQLAATVSAFISNLELHIDHDGHWVKIRGTETYHYSVFMLSEPLAVLGCFRLVSKQDVSGEDWHHLWIAE